MKNQIPMEKFKDLSPAVKALASNLNRVLEENKIQLFPELEEAQKDAKKWKNKNIEQISEFHKLRMEHEDTKRELEFWRNQAIELKQEKEAKLPDPALVPGCEY